MSMKAIVHRLQPSPSRSNSPSRSSTPDLPGGSPPPPGQQSHLLSEALSHLAASAAYQHDVTPTAKLAALASPCFFHRRLDDAVNVEKVLEEIAGDEYMSHSRLLQTATGVREVSKQLQRRPIKRAVRTVMIVTKARDNNLVYLTRELTEWLMRTPRYGSELGVTVYVDHKLKKSKRFDAPGLVAQEPKFEEMLQYWTPDLCWSSPEKFDLVITLGGDGTVLFTSWLFQRIVPPILTFSLGSLGFLTAFDFENYQDDLDQVMGGLTASAKPSSSSSPYIQPSPKFGQSPLPPLDSPIGTAVPSTVTSHPTETVSDAGMRINLRMRFTCTVYRAPQRSSVSRSLASTSSNSKASASTSSASRTTSNTSNDSFPGESLAQFEVLNELVIDRGPSPYVSNLELYGDDQLLTVIQADGVIFSTPTGSTAYSLSAGGSLVHPDIPAILLTPICPHTLSFRPMLLNETVALKVAVPRSSRATAFCSFDGKSRIELRPGDYVSICASSFPFPMVVPGKSHLGWIDSVSRTLRWNVREARQKGWGAKDSHRPSRAGVFPGALDVGLPPAALEDLAADEDVEAGSEEEDFDIEFDDDEDTTGKDSGYGGETAPPSKAPSTGTGSPFRSNSLQA